MAGIPILYHAVVPAHAGVIRLLDKNGKRIFGGPRTCGGDPMQSDIHAVSAGWSPHMRG